MIVTLEQKHCSGCRRTLAPESFARDRSTTDGLGRYCRLCRNERAKKRRSLPGFRDRERAQKRQYYQANKASIKTKTTEYRKVHPEIFRKAGREWKARNPEYYADYYLANREKILAKNAAWIAQNPIWARTKQARRRALKSGSRAVKYSPAQLSARLSMYSGCYLCGNFATAADHVKPLAKQGWDCLSNLRPICTSCNSKKGAKWPYAPVLRRRSHR